MSRKTNKLRRRLEIERSGNKQAAKTLDKLLRENSQLVADLAAAKNKLKEPFQCFKAFVNTLPNFRTPDGHYQIVYQIAMREFIFGFRMQRGYVGDMLNMAGDYVRNEVIKALMEALQKDHPNWRVQ